jgi:hypothetical protein
LIRTAGETYIEYDLRVGGCGHLWSIEEIGRHVHELAAGDGTNGC